MMRPDQDALGQTRGAVKQDELMAFLAQVHRDLIRTETRLCRLAIALGHAQVLHRDTESKE